MGADFHKLMHAGEAAQCRPISHLHVSGELGAVGDGGFVAHHAVVRHVHVSHDPVLVADRGHTPIPHGAAIETAILANGVAITDREARRFTLIFFVLIGFTQRDKMKNAIVAADAGMPGDDIVMADAGIVADFHIAIDDRVCTNRYSRAQLRSRIDDRGGMDTHGSGRGDGEIRV